MKSLKECYEGCQFGCEFSWKRMTGTCRVPEHENCALIKRNTEANRKVWADCKRGRPWLRRI